MATPKRLCLPVWEEFWSVVCMVVHNPSTGIHENGFFERAGRKETLHTSTTVMTMMKRYLSSLT